MYDQFADSYRWIAAQPIDWSQMFVSLHYVGLAVALGGALAGDGLGIRVLLTRGPKPSRRSIRLIHAAVIWGLAFIWISGIAMLVQRFTIETLPAKLIFKFAAATVLGLNAVMIRDFLMPLAARVKRPIAGRLDAGEACAVALIGAVSISSWVALAAVAFAKPLQSLPLQTLFLLYGGLIATLAAACLVCIAVVRLAKPAATKSAPKRRRHDVSAATAGAPPRNHQPVAAPGQRANFAGPRLVVSDGARSHDHLTQRLRQSLAAQRSNDNSERHVRERLEHERLRLSQQGAAQHGHGRGHASGPAPRQRAASSAHRAGESQSLMDRLRGSGGGPARQPRQGRKRTGTGETAPTGGGGEVGDITLKDVRARCRRALFGAGAISLVANLLMLAGPLFMLQIYDRVLTSKSLPTLTALFALVIALFVFMGVLDLIRSRLLVRIGLRVDRLMSARIFDHSIEIAAPNTVRERAQLQKDLAHVRQFISGAGTTAIFDMPWVPVYFALVVMFHWALGAVALAGAGVLVLLSLANELMSRKPVSAAAKHGADAERLLEAGRQQREVLHAMGMTPRYRARWIDAHSSELIVNTKASDVTGLLSVATKISRLALQSAMLAMGAYLVLANEVTAGVMIASSIIMSRALAPIELAISHWRGFIAARQGFKRLGAALDQARPKDRLALPHPEGHLRIENLFAGPIGTRDPVLKGIDFELAPGDALGVLGPSGSGKSTLARVLVGVWPAVRGRVCLDGAPLAHWPLEQLGEHVGYLPQDAMLFEGTVAENIARFNPEADPAEIIAAARSANVHDMILSLAEGYNTRVGEGGAVLSGGQRQRIALARALFGGPSLIVLDEPNSNLDQSGEAALANAIATVRRAGRTVVVMAHRRKALEQVSHILVLKDGRQAAFGAKEDILSAARQQANEKRRQAGVAT